MIVKIWPIKADYATEKSKVGGKEGLKNALDYITNDDKVIADRNNVVKMNVVDDENVKQGPDEMEDESQSRVFNYMANSDKIKGKYISTYLCNEDDVMGSFNDARECTLAALNRKVTKEKGAIAFHIVQSFPEGLDISDEEVHQCGLELCEKLNSYQAVICSHVHPVVDEEGETHGKSKHNHILINAYIHPDKLDPEHPEIAKYHDCKETYAQLRAWNDEIAISHGLPIIRNPDDDRVYSWKENDEINKNRSWKQQVRNDIDEGKRASNSWDDYLQIMKDKGYQIKEGAHVSYTSPDGKHVVRGYKLGRQYAKATLLRYWERREQALNAVEEARRDDSSPALLDVVLSTEGNLFVAVPLGMKSIKSGNFYYLPLENATQSSETLNTYFNQDERYDICDKNKQPVYAGTGKEIIECLEKLRDGKQKYIEDRENPSVEKKHDDFDFFEKRKKKRYYVNVMFINSRTKKPYKTSLYDESGRRRSALELLFLLALTVLKNEPLTWETKNPPVSMVNEPLYAPRSWKIQNMIDSIDTAKEEEIETPAELDQRLKEAGADYSRANSALKKTVRAKEKMETLNEAVKSYRQTAALAQMILDMPDDQEKKELSKEYQEELEEYKSAKAVLYRYKVTTEEEIADFEDRYKKIKKDIKKLDDRLDLAKEEYRRLKKLSHNVELAQNTQYCYGVNYAYQEMYKGQDKECQHPRKNGLVTIETPGSAESHPSPPLSPRYPSTGTLPETYVGD